MFFDASSRELMTESDERRELAGVLKNEDELGHTNHKTRENGSDTGGRNGIIAEHFTWYTSAKSSSNEGDNDYDKYSVWTKSTRFLRKEEIEYTHSNALE